MNLIEKLKNIREIPGQVLKVFKRFPATIILNLILAIQLIMELHKIDFFKSFITEIIYTLIMASLSCAVLDLIQERFAWKKYWRISGYILSCIAAGFCAFSFDGMDNKYLSMLICIEALGIIAANLFDGKDFEINFAKIINRSVESSFCGWMLLVLLALITYSINALLFEFDSRVYAWEGILIYTLFTPMMFLGGLAEKNQKYDFPKVLQRILRLMIVPLVVVYTIVLYCYYMKLLITWDMPISLLGGISLGFLIVSLPTLTLIDKFEDTLSQKVSKYLPYFLLPVLLLLFLTVGKQIFAYGFTLTRYIVLSGGIAMTIFTILLKYRSGCFKHLGFLAIALAAVLSAVGPLDMYKITTRSQNARIEKILHQSGAMIDGEVVAEQLSDETKIAIQDICNYLDENDMEIEHNLNIDFVIDKEIVRSRNTVNVVKLPEDEIMELTSSKKYQYFQEFSILKQDDFRGKTSSNSKLHISQGAGRLKITYNKKVLFNKKAEELAVSILNNFSETDWKKGKENNYHYELRRNSQELSYAHSDDALELLLIFSEVRLITSNEEKEYMLRGYLFCNVKN